MAQWYGVDPISSTFADDHFLNLTGNLDEIRLWDQSMSDGKFTFTN